MDKKTNKRIKCVKIYIANFISFLILLRFVSTHLSLRYYALNIYILAIYSSDLLLDIILKCFSASPFDMFGR